jgi:hypothetical protein
MSKLGVSVAWLIMTHIILAQSEVATLSGTVTDTTSAILHNVSVITTNRERTFRSQQRGTIPAVSCSPTSDPLFMRSRLTCPDFYGQNV